MLFRNSSIFHCFRHVPARQHGLVSGGLVAAGLDLAEPTFWRLNHAAPSISSSSSSVIVAVNPLLMVQEVERRKQQKGEKGEGSRSKSRTRCMFLRKIVFPDASNQNMEHLFLTSPASQSCLISDANHHGESKVSKQSFCTSMCSLKVQDIVTLDDGDRGRVYHTQSHSSYILYLNPNRFLSVISSSDSSASTVVSAPSTRSRRLFSHTRYALSPIAMATTNA